MRILSKLKLTNAERDDEQAKIKRKRQRLINRLDEQLQMIEAEMQGQEFKSLHFVYVDGKKVQRPKKVNPMYFQNSDGVWFMELRYGNKRLDLGRKRFAVECGIKQNIPAVLIMLKKAIAAGELDSVIIQAVEQNMVKSL